MTEEKYDIVVIGGGPGGYVAAIRAAQLGKKVALVEKENLGGTCLNWGCIPTKALLESAQTYINAVKAHEFGVICNDVTPNISTMVQRSRKIVEKLTAGVRYLMEKNNIKVFHGHGRIESCGKNKVVSINNKDKLITSNIIIATGARNKYPPGIKVDGDRIWDCRHAMNTESIPKSIIIIGAGAIGLEFASFFNALGSKVTVIEYADRIVQGADHDISSWALQAFKRSGISFVLKTCIENVKSDRDSIVVYAKPADTKTMENLNIHQAERCLIATGIQPNTEDLGLENAPGILLEKGGIQVGPGNVTGEDGIYAIGDVVANGPWLAHKATQEGIRCVENICEPGSIMDLKGQEIPMCVYSMPQIAQIGLTEEQALQNGIQIKAKICQLSNNGKALTEMNEGIVKVILEEKTGIFVGAHMVGKHVTELISNYSLFQYFEGLPIDLHHTVFPHPTLSEIIQEALIAADGYGIHS